MDFTMGFRPELIPLIRARRKILTYRVGEKWARVNTGQTGVIFSSDSGESAGEITILSARTVSLSEIRHDQPGHEIYADREEMTAVLQAYYPETIITDQTPIRVFGFIWRDA